MPFTISWTSPNSTDGLSHYIVWSSKTGEHVVDRNATSFNETVSLAGGNQYRVAVVYENGNKVYSEYLNFFGGMWEGNAGLGFLTLMLLCTICLIAMLTTGGVLVFRRRRKIRNNKP